jgi:ferredoxin-nitrite reductase
VAHLNKRVQLAQPINIHLTAFPNSRVQQHIGDIGLQGVKVNASSSSVEGYNIALGDRYGADATVAKEVFEGISYDEMPKHLEQILRTYLHRLHASEWFAAFTRRHEVKQLQEMFSS